MPKENESKIFGATRSSMKKNRPTGRAKANGRPQGQSRDTTSVMVVLQNQQIGFLDRISVSIREKSGKSVKRAALIRAMIDAIKEEEVHTILEEALSEEDVRERLSKCLDIKRWK